MKRFLFLICGLILCNSDLYAQKAVVSDLQPVLHTTSAEVCKQYQKVTDSLIGNVKKFSEANFWVRYKRLMFAYSQQWSTTEQFSGRVPTDAPKPVRKAWKLLETARYDDAVASLQPILSGKRLREKDVSVYRFVMEVSRASADFRLGSDIGWKLLASGLASIEDSLLYADCLMGMFAFDEAMAVQDLIENGHVGDTLMIARLRYLRGRTLRFRMDTVRALAPLIESAYWLHELRPSPGRDALLRRTSLEMTSLYSNNNDFDNAMNNAREALSLSVSSAERAEAMLALGALYMKAGGMQDAEKMLDSAYSNYKILYQRSPERFGPLYCSATEAFANVQRWYDRNTRYQQLLEEECAVLANLSQYGIVTYRFALAQTYFNLGHKFMNMDLKIVPAEQSWQKADSILKGLIKENVVLAGDLYVDNNYKLAGCKSAFNKTTEAKEYFLKSLEVRRRLYATAPKAFSHDLATVLVQNANFDANEKKYEWAVEKLDEAEARTKENGDDRMLEEIVNFRDFLKSKMKK